MKLFLIMCSFFVNLSGLVSECLYQIQVRRLFFPFQSWVLVYSFNLSLSLPFLFLSFSLHLKIMVGRSSTSMLNRWSVGVLVLLTLSPFVLSFRSQLTVISLRVQSLSWLIPQQYLTLLTSSSFTSHHDTVFLPVFSLSLSYISFLGWPNLPLLTSSVLAAVCQDCVLGPLPSDWSTLPGWPHPCLWRPCTVTMPLTPASYLEVPRTSLDSLSPKSHPFSPP